jgi:hypothetical protein
LESPAALRAERRIRYAEASWTPSSDKDEDQAIPGRTVMAKAQSRSKFFLCIVDRDCDDLEKGKVYAVLPDACAKRDGYLRVVDESGEDYLYPESYFVPIDLPSKAKAALGVEM